MTLRRLLLCSALALGFVAGNPAAAKADPVTATIAAVSAFASTAVGSFVVNAALSAAVSWGASKLMGKNKAGVSERQASVQTLSLGEVPREALIGETITGGSLVDVFYHGGQYGTDYVTRCIALADHKIEALLGYYIDDVYYPWTANGLQAGFSNALDMEFVNASASGTPPPSRWLAASGWSNNDVGVGVTRIWVSAKFDEKVWPQGLPQMRFVVRGLKVYDPRKDAALGYAGGGAQTWSNPATHTWSRNATLLRYAMVRGVYIEGHQGEAQHLLIGRGLTPEEAPPARIIAPANLCDEDVDGAFADGPTLYTANGTIRASDTFISVEEWFAAAMAGVIVQREGGVEIEPGQAKAAVMTITDGDLVVGEPVTFSAFLNDGDGGRINTVVPRYVSPAQKWKDFAGPVRRDLADITKDGGPREMTLSLILVTDGRQADWCAEIVRRSSRLEKRATIVLPPDCAMLEEGDWIAWQSDRRHAGATVRYQVAGWSMGKDWRMRLSLREIASSVYGVPDPVTSTATTPPGPATAAALTLPGAAATATLVAGSGPVQPGIRFSWTTPVDPGLRAVRAEVRIVGQTDPAVTRTEAVESGVMVATNGVAASRSHEARLVPIGDPWRTVTPSAWFPVTTGALGADVLNTALFGPNANRVPLSDFDRNATGWSVNSDPYALIAAGGFANFGTSGGRRFFNFNAAFTAAGQYMSVGQTPAYAFRVTPGERLSVSMRRQGEGPVAVLETVLFWVSATGAVTSQSLFSSAGSVPYGTYAATFVTVPATAYSAWIEQYVTASGAGAFTNGIIEPMVASANAGQTLHPPYSPGPLDVIDAVRWIDDTGRIIDGRGMPLNALQGAGVVFTRNFRLEPGPTPSTQITVLADTATVPGGFSYTLPAATISGLAPDTGYSVFRDVVSGAYVPLATGATSYIVNPSRYLGIGVQRTAQTGGGYTPPPDPPPGSGGGPGLSLNPE